MKTIQSIKLITTCALLFVAVSCASPSPRAPLGPKEARVIGGGTMKVPILVAPAEQAPPRDYQHEIVISEGKNRIAIQEDPRGNLFGAFQAETEKKGHFKEIEFYAKGGHEYLVDFASTFPVVSYWKYRVTDTSTGEVVAKVDVTRH